MSINENQLKKEMTLLLEELSNSPDKKTSKKIIAKAVSLGMLFQEQKIKEGINIVFEELNKK